MRPACLPGMHITEADEVVGCRHHLVKYGDLYVDWDTANLNEAQQTVATISFIISFFLTVYQYLSHIDGSTVNSRRPHVTLVPLPHQLIASVTTMYKEERKIVDSGFSDITAQSEQIANIFGSSVSMPQTASYCYR